VGVSISLLGAGIGMGGESGSMGRGQMGAGIGMRGVGNRQGAG
jgi:hypothetical protein